MNKMSKNIINVLYSRDIISLFFYTISIENKIKYNSDNIISSKENEFKFWREK